MGTTWRWPIPCLAGARRSAGQRVARLAAATAWAAAAVLAGPACAPRTPEDIVARSVKAHGGPALTAWRTQTVTGRIRIQDGIPYNAAYRLYAQVPGQVRVEHDLTADRGRAFYEYFLDNGVAWVRRNLVVSPYEVERAQRLLDQCQGIAFYARAGVTLERRPDAEVVWPAVEGWDPAVVPGPRAAYVVAAKVGPDTREVFVDKATYYFLLERDDTTARYFADVRVFGGVRLPTRVLEVVKARNRETATPLHIESVVFDAPIDPSLFIEDKPRHATRSGRGVGNPERP